MIGVWLGSVVLLTAWFFLLRPAFLGGPVSYVMVSGISMEPTMYTGDLALARRQAGYQVGDVVAYRVETEQGTGLVIHRIVGGSAQDGFIMQGDNNDFRDSWRPTPDQVAGKALVNIPRVGSVFSYLQNPVRMAAAVGAISLYISGAGWFLAQGSGSSRGRRRQRRERIAQRRGGLAAWLSGW
jgi:signal peptidase